MRAKTVSKNIAITLPASTDWNEYQKELDLVKDYKYVLNFKVPNFPTQSGKGAKCYLNYRGNLIGWMEIVGFSEEEFTCYRDWEINGKENLFKDRGHFIL